MHKMSFNIALLAAGLTAGGFVVAGGRPSPGSAPPVIAKVAMSANENAIVITGWNFGGTAPTVRLGEYVLDVKTFSDNRVVAGLPPHLEAATYRLTLTSSSKSRFTSDVFSAALPGMAGMANSAE